MDFLTEWPRDEDGGTEIVTFDLISLYTSIPHEFGFGAIDYFLTKYQKDLYPRFKKEFVLELENFILKNNALTFDSEFYLQTKGTATGTIFAPTYANLIMGYHQIKVYLLYYPPALRKIENSLFRFSDDCQILLKVNLIKPGHLLSIFIQINNNIQFTMEKSQTRLHSLDIMTNKSDTKIWMVIYSKPTYSKLYVPFMPNQPRHCLTNIPLSLAGV